MDNERDVAIVLSGGSINGVLMELGFLKRLRESELSPRVGWVFGASSGALAGTMFALGRLDDLEEFLLGLQPKDVFRANRLWRLPLTGSHEYTLPQTIAERLADVTESARQLASGPIEVVVCATDLTGTGENDGRGPHAYELVYSSKESEPELFGQAVLASAAMSGLVRPVRVGDRIATDGGWTRNFPLGHAYDRPAVQRIVAFRYLPRYPPLDIASLVRLRRRLEPFTRIPPVRALVAELRDAEERTTRGEPAHAVDTLLRLMRVAVVHNTELEEQRAASRDDSIRQLAELRRDAGRLVRAHVRDLGDRERLERALDERFADSRFPFRADRLVPRITVRATPGPANLEVGRRDVRHWEGSDKRELIERGYELTDRELGAAAEAREGRSPLGPANC